MRGFLFFYGVSGNVMLAFYERHQGEIAALFDNPHAINSMLIDGVTVEYRPEEMHTPDGVIGFFVDD